MKFAVETQTIQQYAKIESALNYIIHNKRNSAVDFSLLKKYKLMLLNFKLSIFLFD